MRLHKRAGWHGPSLPAYNVKGPFHAVPDRAFFFFFNWKVLMFFLFFPENICCGYSLEAPFQGTSNEYPQHTFGKEIRKILI